MHVFLGTQSQILRANRDKHNFFFISRMIPERFSFNHYSIHLKKNPPEEQDHTCWEMKEYITIQHMTSKLYFVI